MRCFVAIPLPVQLRSALALAAAGIEGARWVDGEQLHLTLAFLGELQAGRGEGRLDAASEVIGTIAGACTAPLVLRLGTAEGSALSGRTRTPRILWVRLAESSELLDLQARVVRALRSGGFSLTNERFIPHVTVARLRDVDPSEVTRWITTHTLWEHPPFEAEGIGVYGSVLRPDGARHHLHSWHPLPVTPRARSHRATANDASSTVAVGITSPEDVRGDGATDSTLHRDGSHGGPEVGIRRGLTPRMTARLRRDARATRAPRDPASRIRSGDGQQGPEE